ncbi:MAG: hypothetical protein II838_13600, partial [Lachnospiraceae bacterium]|nr:hypothetical protein [Lachnospiraceae bacterium]
TTVAIKATNGAKDKLTIKTSKSSVVKIGKSSVTADKNGKASVTLRGLAAGTSTITVKSANTGMYAKVKITVKADETATAAPASDAPATLAPATDAPVGPTVVPTSGGAVTTAPTSGGAVTAAPTATPTTPATVATLSAVTASAISTNKIAFTFNRTVTASAIKADSVVVTETAERKFVKSVTASTTKANTIELELFDALTTAKDYTVTVPVEGNNYSLTFKFVQGEAASIVVANQVVPAGDATAIEYKVLDANGLDITKVVSPTFSSDKAISDGKITLADKQVAFVKVSVTLPSGVTIESNQFTITGQTKIAKEMTNYTVAAAKPTFSSATYKQNLNVQISNTSSSVYSEFKDQFGEVFTGSETYESLDTSVAVVDKTTGLITPIAVGTAPIKITNGDFSKTIMIKVVADSKIQKIVAEDTALTIYKGLTNNTATTNVYLEDQYGITNTTGIECAKLTNNNLVKATVNGSGVLTVTYTGSTTGTEVIKVTDATGTFSQNIVITIAELGTIVGYNTNGVKTSLDVNSSTTITDKNYNANTMSLSVNPVDKDGKVAGDPSEFTWSITDGTKELSNTVDNAVASRKVDITIAAGYASSDKNTITVEAGKTYTVTIKVGDLKIKTFKFDTVDTRVAPTVSVAKTKASIDKDTFTNANTLAEAFQADGVINVSNDYKLSDLKFTSTDATVISTPDNTGAILIRANGSANIVLKSVKVTKVSDPSEEYTVALTGTIALTIAEDTVAPKALSASYDDTDGEGGVKGTVKVQFSERMDTSSVEDKKNWSITGEGETVAAVNYDEITKVATVTIKTANLAANDVISFVAVTDAAGNSMDVSAGNALKYSSSVLTVVDKVAPTITSIATSDDKKKVTIVMSEAIEKTTLAGVTFVKGEGEGVLLTPADKGITLSDDGKTIYVNLSAAVSGGEKISFASTVKDVNGNTMTVTDKTVNASGVWS